MMSASDANWALSLQAFYEKKPGFGILVGGGLAIWLFWVLGTWIGVYFGEVIRDPKAYGLDMVVGCFLFAVVIGKEKHFKTFFVWLLAASSSMLAYKFLPDNSHVIVGALTGGIAGVLLEKKSHA